jgi:hypothetical protein
MQPDGVHFRSSASEGYAPLCVSHFQPVYVEFVAQCIETLSFGSALYVSVHLWWYIGISRISLTIAGRYMRLKSPALIACPDFAGQATR